MYGTFVYLQVVVELRCTFLKINDIDTINQQFEAELFVQAKWEEPLLQQSIFGSKDKVDLNLHFLFTQETPTISLSKYSIFHHFG